MRNPKHIDEMNTVNLFAFMEEMSPTKVTLPQPPAVETATPYLTPTPAIPSLDLFPHHWSVEPYASCDYHPTPTVKNAPPPAKNGIFFAENLIISQDNEALVAVFGGSGSGKTECCMKHSLFRTWTEPFVAMDIKGDLCVEYETTENARETVVLSLREEMGHTLDPFDFIQSDGEENKVANIRELVEILIPLPVNINDPLWKEAPRCIVTAAMLFFYNQGMDDFISIMAEIATTPPATLIQAIAESNDTQAKIYVNNFIKEVYVDEKGKESIVPTNKKVIVVNCDSKMLLGISQEITNRLAIFASDQRIMRILGKSDKQIKWEDLDKYNVFISVEENRLSQYSVVLSLIITQLIRTMERRPEMHSPEGKDQQKILLALDEFPRLGKMEVIADAVSTLRSKGVTMLLVMQSLAQLDRIYGKETRRVIMDNMTHVAIFKVTDAESQEYFSRLCGTKSEIHEPVIRPHEFATLKDIAVVTPDGLQRVEKEFYHKRKNAQN
jgi:type IV secretion system protein VirD4